jgi:hypothetical protein
MESAAKLWSNMDQLRVYASATVAIRRATPERLRSIQAINAHAINDDTGGPGGVGVALLYPNGLSFGYIDSDGLTHLGPSPVISHTYAPGDLINITNFGGSFGLSIYSTTDHSTQMAASGCAL